MKIIICWGHMGVDSSNGSNYYNAKTSTICSVPLLKKSRKTHNFFKDHFFVVPDYFSNGTDLRVGIFCNVTSASRRLIQAIKHPHIMIFFFGYNDKFFQFFRPLGSKM